MIKMLKVSHKNNKDLEALIPSSCLTSAVNGSYCLVDDILGHDGQIYAGVIVSMNRSFS